MFNTLNNFIKYNSTRLILIKVLFEFKIKKLLNLLNINDLNLNNLIKLVKFNVALVTASRSFTTILST